MNTQRFYKPLLVLFILILSTSYLLSAEKASENTASSFDKNSGELTLDVIQLLASNHYQNKNIDDDFSQQLFKNYLDTLDPAHMFFLQSDVDTFYSFEKQLDNQILAGNLSKISKIYSTYSGYYSALLNDTIENLDTYIKGFDFTKNEEILLDRSEAKWPITKQESKALWLSRIKNDVLTLKMSDKTLDKIIEELRKRYTSRLERFNQITADDAYDGFINQVTSMYDPHTSWLSPKAYENFNINMSLSLEGIGAVLQSKDEFTKVVRLVTAGPAAKAGQLKAGDTILAVAQGKSGDFQDIVGWSLHEVVQLIRGPKNSIVRLQIGDLGEEPKTIEILRDKVKLEDQAAKQTIIETPSSSIEGKTRRIGIIALPTFYMDFKAHNLGDKNYRSTTRDVKELLRELLLENVDGVVLDLRNNGGGSLTEAANLTDLFIDKGPVVQIRNSDKRVSLQYKSESGAFYRRPLLVLTNEFSASASEIFAGAIQDYQRGLVVGGQSFGKGTVQTLEGLDVGQLKYTTAKFYRISGDSTQNRGVIPDISYPSLYDLDEIGEKALDYALAWDQIPPVSHGKYLDIKPFLSDLKNNHQARTEADPDFQYLLSRIDYLNERKDIKTLSLNEKTRRQERTTANNTILELTNTIRKQKGEEPFKTFEDYEADLEEKNAERSASITIDVKNDFLLRESAQILSDFIDLTMQEHANTVAKSIGLEPAATQ